MAGKLGTVFEDAFSPQMATPNGVPIRASQVDDVASETRMLSKSLDDAPTGGDVQSLTGDFDDIARFREKANLPKFNPTEEGVGTVVYAKSEGKKVFGVNSGFSANSKALRKATFANVQTQLNKLVGRTYNHFQSFLHAEAHSLMRMHRKLAKRGKSMPEEVELFVDRKLCMNCRTPNGLPRLAELFGIKRLKVHSSNGDKFLIRPGKRTVRLED